MDIREQSRALYTKLGGAKNRDARTVRALMDEHLEMYLALQAVHRWFDHDPPMVEVMNRVTMVLRAIDDRK